MLHWFDVSDGVSDCVSARNEQTGDEKRKQGVLGLVGELEMVLICACEFLDSGMAQTGIRQTDVNAKSVLCRTRG